MDENDKQDLQQDAGDGSSSAATDDRPAGCEVEIDWESLAIALENQLPESHSFLDLSTGQVVTFTGVLEQPDPPEPRENFLYIPPRPSREGYRTMQKFLANLEDEQLRNRLAQALVGRGAFRRFKDCLLDYPQERQRWFAFKDAEVYAFAARWLEQNQVVASNPPPPSNGERPLRPLPGLVRRPAVEPADDFHQAIAPYDRPALVFRPERTALLVIDMQRIFVDPQGSAYLSASGQASERLQRVLEAARNNGLRIYFTRHRHRYPASDGGSMSRWWRSLILDGSRDAELAEGFQPRDDEPVIDKCRYSAFCGTPLEAMLRAGGVEDVIIGGVMTNLCCETTARDAFVRDFNVFFLADATATVDADMHRGSLRNIAYGFGRVLSAAEAIRVLERQPARRAQESNG